MRTQSSLAVSDRIQFHRQQPRTVGTRCLVHQALRCMLDMCHSRRAAASAFLTESDRSLQKNCSECVTAPPRNFRSLRSRIPAGRASHAWLSHAPRATTEANTLRCTTEVPVLVYYLLFFDGTGPAAPGYCHPSTTPARSAASRPLGHHRAAPGWVLQIARGGCRSRRHGR